MNRFISGLLDRAEGRAAVLERRPRALFEPRVDEARSIGAPDLHELRAEVPVSTQRAQERDEPLPTRTRRNASRNERAEDAAAPRPSTIAESPHVHVEQPSTQPMTRPALDVPHVRTASLPHTETAVRAHRATPPDSRQTPLESTARASTVIEVRHVAEREAARKAPSTTERAPSSERRVPALPPTRPRATKVDEPVRIPSPTRRLPASRSPEFAVRLAKSQAPAIARRERTEPPVATPVQISIGRVEVRAVTGRADRTPAKAPAVPRLSLDDYLRQRNGERK